MLIYPLETKDYQYDIALHVCEYHIHVIFDAVNITKFF